MGKIIIVLAIAVCSYGTVFGETYKWVDDNGVMSFTDNPRAIPPKNRKKVEKLEDHDLSLKTEQPTQPSHNTLSGSKEEVWQQCRRAYRNQLQNPDSAIYEDSPEKGVSLYPNGTFLMLSTIYARVWGGQMKKFTATCRGNIADYSTLEASVF